MFVDMSAMDLALRLWKIVDEGIAMAILTGNFLRNSYESVPS